MGHWRAKTESGWTQGARRLEACARLRTTHGDGSQPPETLGRIHSSHLIDRIGAVSHDTDKLIQQLSLVAFLMAERRPLTAREIKSVVEGYSEMS